MITWIRRWFAAAMIAVVLMVAGVYFYARHRIQNALKQVPEKIGLDIQQSAKGFTISRSEQGHTLFKIEASKAVQFKQGERAELHDVTITIYGRDSERYDRIYGSDFEYNQQTGEVAARGEVQIDLEANPEGILNPDQAPPGELKNPLHLKTSELVFNQKTGDAHTTQKVEFELPQARGSAMGANYVAQTGLLTLDSQVALEQSGPLGTSISAARAAVTKDVQQVLLEHPHIETIGRQSSADHATLFLRPDNTVDRILASGNVLVRVAGIRPAEMKAEQLELFLSRQENMLRSAIFSGAVTAQISGPQPIDTHSDRVVLAFKPHNLLQSVRAEGAVQITQEANGTSATQNLELTAKAVDFLLTKGKQLTEAETSGAAQITISAVKSADAKTVVTAGKFDAKFNSNGQLVSLHGASEAKIVSQNPGQHDRVSTSQMLDASFRPGSGMDSIVQHGNIAYVDDDRRAWGDRARYTPADEILVLTGSPRVVQGGMTTTAHSMRFNRQSGEAVAEGSVKTTYSDLKSDPSGALLASSSPIHVTADSMAAQGTTAVAQYTGNVRLWQDANVVEASAIDFDRDQRSMVANASAGRSVSTVLTQTDKDGSETTISITSSRLTYTDSQRLAHFDKDVVARGADVTITSEQIDAFLQALGANTNPGTGKLDRIVATGHVVITQPTRHADGNQMVYTAADDKFVLTGGPPSIFDAEHGKITGVSLTFFRRDDRVLVEGNKQFPTVTQTRVAR
ncbi:MAG TPA: LPS export ABC transporter periplasmic protein LptC [Terriglobales bacterium]|nr:LPS export ABC transporter periplasmic protein LptC [Terriglobales bacterium]